jgi:hypothetical protein
VGAEGALDGLLVCGLSRLGRWTFGRFERWITRRLRRLGRWIFGRFERWIIGRFGRIERWIFGWSGCWNCCGVGIGLSQYLRVQHK